VRKTLATTIVGIAASTAIVVATALPAYAGETKPAPDDPKGDPKVEQPKDDPKGDPKGDPPKDDPKGDPPKDDPKGDPPKDDPKDPPKEEKEKCNSGRGNGSETTPATDCDPGNSGGHNNGGD
jgi:hypothetical protein